MNKLLVSVVILLTLFGYTSSLTVGSCQKYSLDGMSCEQCVNHYHLYEGVCYVDILGCKEYVFGNICHECERDYIMVNNLCCDHNCLAKLFRRQQSQSTSEAISVDFETLSKLIPYINSKHLSEEKLFNLIEIETRDYVDVRRFVFLYEIYSENRVYRWRSVIDVTKMTKKQRIIDVDWSQVPAYENYLDFHHQEISINDMPEEVKMLIRKNQKILVLKKAEFSYLNQYEIVTETKKKNMINYRTRYVWPQRQRKITLLEKSEVLDIVQPEFVPRKYMLNGYHEILTELQSNQNLKVLLNFMETNVENYVIQNIQSIKSKQVSKHLIQYSVRIRIGEQTVTYILMQNVKKNKIKIVDYEVIKSQQSNEDTIGQVEQECDGQQCNEENIVENLVTQTIEEIKGQQKDEELEEQCDGQQCSEENNWINPIKNKHLVSEIDRLFKEQNPGQIDYKIVRKWRRNFQTYRELAFLIKSTQETPRYWYFYVLFYRENKEVVFWGQQSVSEPRMKDNKKGKTVYAHPNHQSVIPVQNAQKPVDVIFETYPTQENSKIIRVRQRVFPENRNRFIVVIRLETSKVRYVVLEDGKGNMWVQEFKVLKKKLPKLNEKIQNQIAICNLVQCQLDPEQTDVVELPEIVLEVPVVTESETTQVSTNQNQQIQEIQFLRSIDQSLENFEILHVWLSENCNRFTEQTYLIKLIGGKRDVYEYHYIMRNVQTGDHIYLGKKTRKNVLKDQQENFILPNPQTTKKRFNEVVKNLLKENTDFADVNVLKVQKRNFPVGPRFNAFVVSEGISYHYVILKNKGGQVQIVCDDVVDRQIPNQQQYIQIKQKQIVEEIIANQVVEKIECSKVTQLVCQEPQQKLQEFILTQVKNLENSQTLKTWVYQVSEKVQEVVVLYKTQVSYTYVNILVTNEQEFEIVSQYTTDQPLTNDQNQYLIPNPHHFVEKDDEKVIKITEFINEQQPQTVGKPIQSIVSREIEGAQTDIVVIKEDDTHETVYIVHEKDDQLEIKDVLTKQTEQLNPESQKVQQIVKTAIESVKEDQEDPATDEQPQDKEQQQKQGNWIEKMFREQNPDIEKFKVVRKWRRAFDTYVEITVLIRSGNLYWYFYVLRDKETKQNTFWGQQITEDPLMNKKGKYIVKNKQKNVPEAKMTDALELIVSSYPQATQNKVRKTLLRKFPDNRIRELIRLRQTTSLVQYVLLTDETGKKWIQETKVIKTDLPSLQKKVKDQVQIQHKTQVLVDQLLTGNTPDESVTLEPVTIELPVCTIKQVKDETNPDVVVETIQSCFEGHTQISYNTLTKKQIKIMERLEQVLPTQFKNQQPVLVRVQNFCDSQDFIIVFRQSDQLVALAFRSTLLQPEKVEYLGQKTVPFIKNEKPKQMMKRILSPQARLNMNEALSTIVAEHPQYQNIKPKNKKVRQLGESYRFVFTFKVKQEESNTKLVHRFIVSSSNDGFKIVEECRLNDKKQKYTVVEKPNKDKPDESVIKTNDPEVITVQIVDVKDVIQIAIKDDNADSGEIIELTETETEDKVEYVVKVEETKNEGQKVQNQITVVKDKETGRVEIVEESQEDKKEQTVIISTQIIEKVAEESVKKINEKQNPENGCCQEQQPEKQVETEKVVIKPEVVKDKVKEILNQKNNEDQQKKPKEITFELEEALKAVYKKYPKTKDTVLISQDKKVLKKSIVYTIVLHSQVQKYVLVVKKNAKRVKVTLEEKSELPKEQTTITEEKDKQIDQVIQTIQEQDTQEYVLIDPKVIWESKALQILSIHKLQEFQSEIDISTIETEDLISTAVIYLRANWAIIQDGVVIRILENINTPNTKQYSFYFFVNLDQQNKSNKYKVYEFVVQIGLEKTEPTYNVLSIKEVIENGKQISVVLHERKQSKEQTTNIAYGYENIPLSSVKDGNYLQNVISQVEDRYGDLIKGQSIVEIQSLELKNGKTNIIIRYPHLYFTVFWDPVLERILLLNSVSSFSSEKYQPVQDIEKNPYYNKVVQNCIGTHQEQINNNDYKIIHSGEIDTFEEFVYYNEIVSGGTKYRCVTAINKESAEIREISWDEIVQISLEHYRFDEITKLFVANYQKLSEEEMKNNKDFKFVYKYVLNHNQVLESAQLIGAAYKPQNLGFAFKLFFMLGDSSVIAIEVYIESFSQKLKQLSFSYSDFSTNFVAISPEGSKVNEIIQALSLKSGVQLVQGEYLIHSVEGKDFLFGNLFKVLIQINGVEYSGLLYHDHTSEETNLVEWQKVAEGEGCKQFENDKIHCKFGGCRNGFYWNQNDRKCYRETIGCIEYNENQKQECKVCAQNYTKVNNVCTEDCGPICAFIKAF